MCRPKLLAQGPIGKLRDGDLIEIVIDRNKLEGSVNFVGEDAATFAARPMRDDLHADPNLPDDTRLWAALQQASGGIWGGCVYDAEAIIAKLRNP